MANVSTPHFQNDQGVPSIKVGVKELMCCGANAPFDHPHVFLDMGSDDEIICPYCSTVYKYAADLGPTETLPIGCLFVDLAVEA
ncbi:MAG: zinc-finger domain-containing protein [Pseudomonadota bacterium]